MAIGAIFMAALIDQTKSKINKYDLRSIKHEASVVIDKDIQASNSIEYC